MDDITLLNLYAACATLSTMAYIKKVWYGFKVKSHLIQLFLLCSSIYPAVDYVVDGLSFTPGIIFCSIISFSLFFLTPFRRTRKRI